MGWNNGVCINLHPAPPPIVTFESQLSCCENSYAGQSSNACLADLPASVQASLPTVWFPVYSDQTCTSTLEASRNHGVNGYETQAECCVAEYGHGRGKDPAKCFAGLPNPPTTSPTPAGGLKLDDVWYPNYCESFCEGR